MTPYVVIEKEVGETPLQALERFRATDAKLAGVPMTYAGRLDPMASGKLLIVIGEECKWREKYDGLDKTYQFEVLLGVESDTGDTLGLASDPKCIDISMSAAETAIQALVGTHHLPYPVFSSRTVDGKPLFEHAHRDAGVARPVREMRVTRVAFAGMRKISGEELLQEVEDKLARVRVPESNDFRLERIVPRWRAVLSEKDAYTILSIEADVTSGTYIRALAPEMAKQLGTRGLAYAIHRTALLI